MTVKPNGTDEWFALAFDLSLGFLGLACMVTGEFNLGLYVILLGGMNIIHRSWRKRAYLDGWLNGRADLVHLQMHSENGKEFVDRMMDADMAMMRRQLGDRQTDKFLAEVAKNVARSDGSHDDLP